MSPLVTRGSWYLRGHEDSRMYPYEQFSAKTDYVLAGEDPGSKLDKAHELKVKVLSESEFEKLL